MNIEFGARRALPVALAAAFAILGWSGGADAQQLTLLHSFCDGGTCPDGHQPITGLVRDSSGNLYGTTYSGGAQDNGVVFELERTAHGYKFHDLHEFCSRDGCVDGENSLGRLIVAADGSLYGTVEQGGAHNSGGVFKLSPTHRKFWKYTLLYSFCAADGCADGGAPMAGLTYMGADSGVAYDGVSPLYGTAVSGGTGGAGVAYQLSFPAGAMTPVETVIYAFCPVVGCHDGQNPKAPLTMDANGNFYGTTAAGGDAGQGVAFKLTPKDGAYVERVIYSFCQEANCTDGRQPVDGLTFDAAGNLFGASEWGGAHDSGSLFKLSPKGHNTWKHTVMHSFCVGGDCSDGYNPLGGLTLDSHGDMVGTTQSGGPHFGTIFRLHRTTLTTLYGFCSVSNCADGAAPYGGVVLDESGNMYGTTITGGASDGGTVFEFSP